MINISGNYPEIYGWPFNNFCLVKIFWFIFIYILIFVNLIMGYEYNLKNVLSNIFLNILNNYKLSSEWTIIILKNF